MRCIVEPLKIDQNPPTLRVFVHGAPHRRMHRAVLQQYRRELWAAAKAAGLRMPIRHNVELTITYINPSSPDLDNLITSTFQALDGKCGKGPTVLADDRLIVFVKMGIMWN